MWQISIPPMYLLGKSIDSVHVDLGCGSLPRNPLEAKKVIGIDVLMGSPFETTEGLLEYIRVTPGSSLPFEANQVDSISAYDFLEHVPRVDRLPNGEITNPFISIMNEIHRILKPGGLFVSVTPCYPSPASFADPTHVNYITEETHLYFSGPNYAKNKGYGFTGEFNVIECDWSDWKGVLWDAYASVEKKELNPSEIQESSRIQKYFKQFKFKIKRKIIGHTGETHLVWVLEKPNNELGRK